MTWDGAKFVTQLRVPEGCEYGRVGLFSNESHYITSRSFLPQLPDGSRPPGAMIAGMNMGGHDRKNWKADIEADLARPRQRDEAFLERMITP
jgi:hypothetical protein